VLRSKLAKKGVFLPQAAAAAAVSADKDAANNSSKDTKDNVPLKKTRGAAAKAAKSVSRSRSRSAEKKKRNEPVNDGVKTRSCAKQSQTKP
jgi:hypothetical protein